MYGVENNGLKTFVEWLFIIFKKNVSLPRPNPRDYLPLPHCMCGKIAWWPVMDWIGSEHIDDEDE